MSKSFSRSGRKYFLKKLTNVDIENVYGILETVISYVLLKNE